VGFDNFQAMIGARQPKLGHFIVEFASPGMGHILDDASCDRLAFPGVAGMRSAIAEGASLNG
jgi:hypothetical protein